MRPIDQVRKTRRENLRRLITDRCGGNVAMFGDSVDKPGSLLSRILSDPPQKTFGEELARDIEAALDLPLLWLDTGEAALAPSALSGPSALSAQENFFLLSVRAGMLKRDVPAHVMQTILFLVGSAAFKIDAFKDGSISDRLRQAMSLAQFESEAELARASGVPQPTINRILNKPGRNGPESNTVRKLASACAVRFEWLNDGLGSALNSGADDS